MWGGGGYYDGYYGSGFYGSQIILVVVILIVGCLFLSCMVGGLWLLYSRQQKEQRAPSSVPGAVQYYPYYAPQQGRGAFGTKDVEMSTEFR